MIKFSISFKLNEIHVIDSFFNEDPKKVFSREALISGEGRPENSGKTGNNRGRLLLCKPGGEFRKSILALWYQNPCDAQFSHMPDQILGKMKV